MNSKTTVLIVGLGNIGMGYDLKEENKTILSHAKAFSLDKNFDLVGGIDPSLEKREIFENIYKIKSYASFIDANKLISPDLIVIASPTDEHLTSVNLGLQFFRPKILLCEKPLAFSLSDSLKIIEICKEKSIPLIVNYPRLSDPGVNIIKKNILSKTFKYPVQGVVWYSKSLYNSGIHFINLMIYFFGLPINYSILTKDTRKIPKKDIAPSFILEFKNVKIIFLSINEQDIFLNEFKLIFSNGVLNYRNAGEDIEWFNSLNNQVTFSNKAIDKLGKKIQSNFREMQSNVCFELNRIIEGKNGKICDSELAYHTEILISSIIEKNF